MVNICLTFDYELFFGDNNGTYDDVLFQPTYELINLLERKGVHATFFADVCSIPVALKYNQKDYVDGFTNQIRYMSQHGQDVQLHLHPHWYNSRLEDGSWRFSNEGYRLHEFNEDGQIHRIIIDGIEYLKDTLVPVDNQYLCIAFRAGGFSIQPHEMIVRELYDCGIRVDSSIAPHLIATSDANYYDYRHNIKTINWCISERAEWWRDSAEDRYLLEIPVATVDKNPCAFLIKRLIRPHKIKLNLGTKRGTYISTQTKSEGRVKSLIRYIVGYNTISMDAYDADYLYLQIKRLSRKVNCTNQTIALIGHPKLVNDIYIENLSRFIDMIQNNLKFSFVSIKESYEKRMHNGNL